MQFSWYRTLLTSVTGSMICFSWLISSVARADLVNATLALDLPPFLPLRRVPVCDIDALLVPLMRRW